MKSILVPIDFSENAMSAVNYAGALAKHLQLDLHLVHAIHNPVADINSSIILLEILMDNAKIIANQKLAATAETLKEQFGITPKIHMDFGLAADYIIKESENLDVDLIVMGTSGASGFVDSLFGSVTSSVIKRGKKPVMAIPDEAKYEKVKVITMANDHQESMAFEMSFIHNLAQKMESRLDIIFIKSENTTYQQEMILNDAKLRQVSIWAPSVYEGITTYLEREGVDLLVLKHHDRNFFEDLIHKSTTKEILRKSSIPLLIF